MNKRWGRVDVFLKGVEKLDIYWGSPTFSLTRFPLATGGIAELIEQSVVENLAECEENQNLLRCILGAKQDKRFISDQ